jgi:hypothetical protein
MRLCESPMVPSKSKIIYFIILTLFENGHKGTDYN